MICMHSHEYEGNTFLCGVPIETIRSGTTKGTWVHVDRMHHAHNHTAIPPKVTLEDVEDAEGRWLHARDIAQVSVGQPDFAEHKTERDLLYKQLMELKQAYRESIG